MLLKKVSKKAHQGFKRRKLDVMGTSKEFKEQQKNIYANYNEKRAFLVEKWLTKKRIVHFLKDLDLPGDEDEWDAYIAHKIKDKMKKKLRRAARALIKGKKKQ